MKVLVANRGEIACRVFQTLRRLNIRSVAIYTNPDADAPHTWMGDERVCIGEPSAYLDANAILEVARKTGASAIHPGYGFLAENAAFAEACFEAGIVFIGPSPEAIIAFGDKRAARQLAERTQVPVVPGAEICDTIKDAKSIASSIGYPVLVKAAGGGGGKGMRRVDSEEQIAEAFDSATREAKSAFNDGRLLIEKYVFPARHVEVQILGDGKDAVVVGDRECSLQRRYQKVIEEAPCRSISEETREGLYQSALALMRAVGYSGAGTAEFLVGPDGAHYFLEVNTRLQVEHPVTEMVTGIDLVKAQIEIAHGAPLPKISRQRGHALEARLNAEDAYNGYLPQSGEILMLDFPHLPFVRIDSGVKEGNEISPYYDSMIAKVIAWGETRSEATTRLIDALKEITLLGVITNQTFLIDILTKPFFEKNETYTTTVEAEEWAAPKPPDWIYPHVEGQLDDSRQKVNNTGDSDTFSPWQSLGGFRMGK